MPGSVPVGAKVTVVGTGPSYPSWTRTYGGRAWKTKVLKVMYEYFYKAAQAVSRPGLPDDRCGVRECRIISTGDNFDVLRLRNRQLSFKATPFLK